MNIKKILALILIVTGLNKLSAQRIAIANASSWSMFFSALVDRDPVNLYSNFLSFTLKPGEKRYFIASKIHEIVGGYPNPDNDYRPRYYPNPDSDAWFKYRGLDGFEKMSQQDYDKF